MEWNDYRIILAIYRARGLPGAASELGVTLSTVFRRLEKIEEQIGQSLFTKTRQAYVPTDIGAVLVKAAERIEIEVTAGARAVTGRDQELSGVLRVTASEVFATFFLARHLPRFREIHPYVRVEIISDNGLVSLASRKADVALRPVRPADETLIGRKVSEIHWSIYRSAKAPNDRVDPLDFNGDEAFVGFIAETEDMRRALTERVEPEGIRILDRSNSLLTNAALAQSGAGDAVLPVILGDSWPGLRNLSIPVPESAGELWVVCHRDMHRSARVRALFDYVIDAAKTDRLLRSR